MDIGRIDVETLIIFAIAVYLLVKIFNRPLIETLGIAKKKVRFIRVQFTDRKKHILHVNEIQAWVGKNNVAKGKKVTFGKQFATTNEFGAQYLVDGIMISKQNGKYKLAHTDAGVDSFLEVDLGKEFPVDVVTVVNRDDCCKELIVGAFIGALDSQRKAVARMKVFTKSAKYTLVVNKSAAAKRYLDAQNMATKKSLPPAKKKIPIAKAAVVANLSGAKKILAPNAQAPNNQPLPVAVLRKAATSVPKPAPGTRLVGGTAVYELGKQPGAFVNESASWFWNTKTAATLNKIPVTFFKQVTNASARPVVAHLHTIIDDKAEIYLNGKLIAKTSAGWQNNKYSKTNVTLAPGTNMFEFKVLNTSGPAGLLASLVKWDKRVLFRTDKTWKCKVPF